MCHRFRPVRFRCASAFVFFCALSCFLAIQARAQVVQTDRADLARSQTGSPVTTQMLEEGHAAPSPNDADLGEQEILKRAERYQPFTIAIGCPIYWTSNVALSRSNELGDFIEAPVAGIYYEPRLTKTLFGLIAVRDQQFYYDKYDEFNFGAFDVDVGLTYVVASLKNLILRGEYNYNRLTIKDSFDDFYSNNALIFNAELPVRIGRAQQISFGAGANISMAAEPETPRRNDYEAYVGYSLSVSRAFNVNAVGRLVVRDYYHQDSRVDISEILALTANYRVTKFFTASAISTFAASQSNHEVFDYNVANVGGALSLSFKF